ncbi:hypothetical protein [Plantactinospora sp. WMMB782]|uniref:hypothetical protein n=1 Tax=Plantactinospora sp. WMMB782 TaxID=3404121 RepID=UPI003B9463E3
MPAYRLDDPALDQAMRTLAAETAAGWPAPSEEQRAELAPLLAPPVEPVKVRRRRRAQVPGRRAA